MTKRLLELAFMLAAAWLIVLSVHAEDTALRDAETAAANQDAEADAPALAVEITEPATGELSGQSCQQEAPISLAQRPTPCVQLVPCDNWDSQNCDYHCAPEECCEATVLIPNSHCPRICV